MNLVNLTPHAIIIMLAPGTTTTVPPSGTEARVVHDQWDAGEIAGIPLIEQAPFDVTGLPDPEAGTVFLVSSMVLDYLVTTGSRRPDLVAPGDLVRDAQGRPIGCRGFRRVAQRRPVADFARAPWFRAWAARQPGERAARIIACAEAMARDINALVGDPLDDGWALAAREVLAQHLDKHSGYSASEVLSVFEMAHPHGAALRALLPGWGTMADRPPATWQRDVAHTDAERERLRLAACSVVAMADTPETALRARAMAEEFRSAACDDVARRVDECIALRADAHALRAALGLAPEATTAEVVERIGAR